MHRYHFEYVVCDDHYDHNQGRAAYLVSKWCTTPEEMMDCWQMHVTHAEAHKKRHAWISLNVIEYKDNELKIIYHWFHANEQKEKIKLNTRALNGSNVPIIDGGNAPHAGFGLIDVQQAAALFDPHP